MKDDLARLAELVRQRNEWELAVTQLIARPAAIGHLGEYIASRIFGIRLNESASNKGIDGVFAAGQLAGCSVNIKWYAQRDGCLDVTPDFVPDYYLVLVGPPSKSSTSRGLSRSWLIEGVYLFNAATLREQVRARGIRLGTACSISSEIWEAGINISGGHVRAAGPYIGTARAARMFSAA